MTVVTRSLLTGLTNGRILPLLCLVEVPERLLRATPLALSKLAVLLLLLLPAFVGAVGRPMIVVPNRLLAERFPTIAARRMLTFPAHSVPNIVGPFIEVNHRLLP